MRHTPRNLFLLLAACALVFAPAQPRAQEVGRKYLRQVQAYADALLTHGRDRRGTSHSPLVATTLDRKTFAMFDDMPPDIPGVPEENRVYQGANPMQDQNLYQILYALTVLTGEPRYASSADEILEWFFVHCQSSATGLMAWGDHMGWDFETEAPIKKPAGTLHAFARPWVLWDRCYALTPLQSLRFAKGLWNYQIGDRTTGNFSKRAMYDQYGPSINADYPDHGGYYIATWATAVEELKNPKYLSDLTTWPIAVEQARDNLFTHAIRVVTNYFEARRSPETGALARDSATPVRLHPWRGYVVNPARNLSLAIDLWNGALAVDSVLAEGMRFTASRTDSVFLRLPHDPKGTGFVTGVNRNSLKPFGEAGGQHSNLWVGGEGRWTTAGVANLCAARYRQTGIETYRSLVIAAADAYMTAAPKVSSVGRPPIWTRAWESVAGAEAPVYPRTIGAAMKLMLHAYLFTRDGRYLLRAERFADFGIRTFFGDPSPLPRATHRHDHYEAVTGADTFMMAMLEYYAVRNGRLDDVALVWSDR